jgi:hypothetical protein
LDAAEFRLLRISVHSSFPLRQSKEEISCTSQDPTEQCLQHHVFGFRTIFVPSFHAAFFGSCNSVLAGEAIFSWVSELSLGQEKKSFLCLSWVVFLAPCIFLVKTFQFATNFCYSTLAPKTMLMVMDVWTHAPDDIVPIFLQVIYASNLLLHFQNAVRQKTQKYNTYHNYLCLCESRWKQHAAWSTAFLGSISRIKI